MTSKIITTMYVELLPNHEWTPYDYVLRVHHKKGNTTVRQHDLNIFEEDIELMIKELKRQLALLKGEI